MLFGDRFGQLFGPFIYMHLIALVLSLFWWRYYMIWFLLAYFMTTVVTRSYKSKILGILVLTMRQAWYRDSHINVEKCMFSIFETRTAALPAEDIEELIFKIAVYSYGIFS